MASYPGLNLRPNKELSFRTAEPNGKRARKNNTNGDDNATDTPEQPPAPKVTIGSKVCGGLSGTIPLPTATLKYNNKVYHVFGGGNAATEDASSSAAASDQTATLFAGNRRLFFSPIWSLQAQILKHFNIQTDIVLSFPRLELDFPLNFVHANNVSTCDVYRLHECLALTTHTPQPFEMEVTVSHKCFVVQFKKLYNLALEGARLDDAITLSSSDSDGSGAITEESDTSDSEDDGEGPGGEE